MTCSEEGHQDRRSDKDSGAECCSFLSREDRKPLPLEVSRKGTQSNSMGRGRHRTPAPRQGDEPGGPPAVVPQSQDSKTTTGSPRGSAPGF